MATGVSEGHFRAMAELRLMHCELLCRETLQRQTKSGCQLQQPGLLSFQVDGGEGADVIKTQARVAQALLDQCQQLVRRATALTSEADDPRRPGGFRPDQGQDCDDGTTRR